MIDRNPDPKLPQQSFTLSTMLPWQVISLIVVAVAYVLVVFTWQSA
jgi:hypothetical protein